MSIISLICASASEVKQHTATVQVKVTPTPKPKEQQTATIEPRQQQPLVLHPIQRQAHQQQQLLETMALEHCYHKQQRPLGIPDAVSRPPAAASPTRKCSTNNQLAQAPVPAKRGRRKLTSNVDVAAAAAPPPTTTSAQYSIFLKHSKKCHLWMTS
ncbi:uncharacterized protein LOC117191484 [Drosophila miranda]|uniref:uncharacterized protein LOC117191484 n=1 Tax=Drosophila miranda TaxID=7229 RepID=UPI00143F58F8|nr:uncharacterized protein LOC117191484 [Drosophila miranda]